MKNKYVGLTKELGKILEKIRKLKYRYVSLNKLGNVFIASYLFDNFKKDLTAEEMDLLIKIKGDNKENGN
jgi:hypothetical protein